MAGTAQKECPSCGAPLPVLKGATEVKCQYCGTTVNVEWTRVPKAGPPLRPTVYVSPGLPRAAVVAIVMTMLLPVCISTFGSAITGAIASRTLTFPVTCGNNEALEIVGKTFSGQGTLITAGLNCKLHIQDSKLSGGVVVLGKVDNEITIENSTLEGTDAAISLDTNGHVHATNGTVLRGTSTAVRGGVNTRIELEDSKVEGGDNGITGDVNTEIHGTRTSIGGHDAGISVQTNGHVFGSALAVTGGVVGIEGGANLEIEFDESSIEGGQIGAKGEGNLHLHLSKKSHITGAAVGVDAGNNLELTLEDSFIRSADTAALMRLNAHLKITRGGRIHGGRLGVDAGENLYAFLQQGFVESDATAFCGKHNAQIEADGASITGTVALHFQRDPELHFVGTTLSGSQLFDGNGCGAPPPRPPDPASRPGPAAPRSGSPSGGALGRPPQVPVAAPAPPGLPPFDSAAAVIALDAATRAAAAQCRSSSGSPEKAFVVPGFSADGRNSGATVNNLRGSAEAQCIEGIFRTVRIPPFDAATRPSGLMRAVDLK
jgi:LSD1 subclass zinc finger protein